MGAAKRGQGTWDRELGAAKRTGNWGQGTGTGNLGRELGAANWRPESLLFALGSNTPRRP